MAAFDSSAFSTSAFSTSAFDFGATPTPTPDTGPPLGGKGDNEKRRYQPYKPTGILHLPKKSPKVSERIDDSRAIQAEIAARLAKEFTEEEVARQEQVEVARLSAAEVDFEIGILLRKKLRTDQEELLLVLLMASAV